MLLEDRLEFLQKKHNSINADHDQFAEHKKPEDIVKHFSEHGDPSKNKSHTDWILNQYKKGHIKQEDTPRVHETLSNFDKHKSKLANKDLNSYKHISHLDDALEPHLGTKSKREEIKDIYQSFDELM